MFFSFRISIAVFGVTDKETQKGIVQRAKPARLSSE